jgi:hypothetical protein
MFLNFGKFKAEGKTSWGKEPKLGSTKEEGRGI